MRDLTTILAALFLLLAFAAGAPQSWAADQQDFGLIHKGEYLTIASDCAACHTKPGSGKPFAGGRPIETPFGTLLSANITPEPDTGIGSWSQAEFAAALKTGIGKGGVHLYPAMPYVYYSKMTDADIAAIWAYISTLKPIRNEVVSNQLPFPFNIRASLRIWNLLYRPKPGWSPDPQKSAEWNRGAYLVEGPFHCGACHTPKSFLGGDLDSRRFQGFVIEGWHAPNITNDRRLGIGSWSADEIVQYLKNGHNKVAGASGPMAEEVEQSSSKISDGDLKAIAVYLKDQSAPETAPPPALEASDPVMKAGQAIYRDQCSACHKLDGSGVADLFPALRDAPSVRAADPTSLIRVVVDGAKTASTGGAPTGPGMPTYGWQLNDKQIAAVLTYVRNAWGNAAAPVPESAVRSARTSLALGAD
jgi:mono/diheme cytochrome c family protein